MGSQFSLRAGASYGYLRCMALITAQKPEIAKLQRRI